MISLENIVKQLSDTELLDQLGNSVGADKEQIGAFTQIGLPTLMEALNRNTNDPDGAASLTQALTKHKGANLDDLSGFLKNVDTDDGEKIVHHILGDKTDKVNDQLSKSTGLDKSQIMKLLIQYGPLLLSYLGNKQDEDHLDSGGVSNLTTSLMGMFANNSQGGGNDLLALAGSMLGDNDNNSGGLLGNLLGKLF